MKGIFLVVNSRVIMWTGINGQNVALFCDEWRKGPQPPLEELSRLTMFFKKKDHRMNGMYKFVQRW